MWHLLSKVITDASYLALLGVIVWAAQKFGLWGLRGQMAANRFEMLSEYQNAAWLHEKSDRFYRYALGTMASAIRWFAVAGCIVVVTVMLYVLPLPTNWKVNIVSGAGFGLVVIFSWVWMICKGVYKSSRQLNNFEEYRTKTPVDIVREVEGKLAAKRTA